MEEQNRNLILAVVLSALVMLAWFVLFPPPQQATPVAETATNDGVPGGTAGSPPAPGIAPPGPLADAPATPDAAAAADAPRVAIETPRLTGSISLRGGRIDDLALKDYRETLEDGSPIVTLLAPTGADPYYVVHGWIPAGGLAPADVPSDVTEWTAPEGATLTPETPVTLTWENGSGLTFRRTVSVDADYMFDIEQTVENGTGAEVALAPYGQIARVSEPDTVNFFILHEGVVARTDGVLSEIDYDDVVDLEVVAGENGRVQTIEGTQDGWIGFTDKYWMTTLIPAAGAPFTEVDQVRRRARHVPDRDAPARDRGRAGGRGDLVVAALRGRQGVGDAAPLPERGRRRGLRRLHRLGLVLLPHQADLRRAALAQRRHRQHGRRHHRAHARDQGRSVPAGLQVLRLDGADEGAAAADGGAQGARGRRPPEDADGHDGALQDQQGEPGRRVPADPAPDSDLLQPLQGDLRHDRACATRPSSARSRTCRRPIRRRS